MESLEIQIMKALEEYTEEVQEAVEDVLEEVGKEAVKKLKKESPKRSGAYAKAWRLKKERTGAHVKLTVYNAKFGSLTHLLENGHRNRSRKGWVAARPHIAKIESWAAKEAERRISEVIKG